MIFASRFITMMTSAIFLLILSLSTDARSQSITARYLVDNAQSYCVDADGDHRLTWARATDDGFIELKGDDFANLRLPGARQLRGYEKIVDGITLRVLTAHNRIRGGDLGTTFFDLCWVSADPINRLDVDREVNNQTQIDSFRQEGARVYAWVPAVGDGQRRIVSGREFRRRGHAIAREDGMRMLITNDYLGMVGIAYMSPTDDCADWCY
jgi:hypothetical protein